MRIRVTFTKTGSLRYIGHLDLHKIWERTVRRAGFPLAYTHGFHPGPRIQVASALPLGFTGRAEMVDLWLAVENTEVSFLHNFKEIVQASAPPGMTIVEVKLIDDRAPALQTRVIGAEYQVSLIDEVAIVDLPMRVKELLERLSLPRQRRGKSYDLRPLIHSLENQETSLSMVLSAKEGATGRPEEVLAELGIPVELARIERIRLIFKDATD